MRVVLEVRVGEVRELPRPPMDLDDIRPLHLAKVGPPTAFVDSKQWHQRVERAPVNVQVVWQQLAHGRGPTRFVDRLSLACSKQQFVGLPARLRVRPQKRPDVTLERRWECGDRWTRAKPCKSQENQEVFPTALSDSVPLL